MFIRIAGGFCLGLGLSLITGLICLITAINGGLNTISDPAGWYGPLEGLIRGSVIFFVGTAATLVIGLVAGVACANMAARSPARWAYLGYPVIVAPIIFTSLILHRARQASQSEARRASTQSQEISKVSREAMAASSEQAQAESRAHAVAKYGDPIGGPAEMDQLGRLMGNLYFPGATLGTNYATRTEPPSIEWPVVSLKCPNATTLEAASAYYDSIGCRGTGTEEGATVVRPGDGEAGRLTIRYANPGDPDQGISVTFIVSGF